MNSIIKIAFAATAAFAANASVAQISASTSAGFDSAQITDNKSQPCTWGYNPITGQYGQLCTTPTSKSAQVAFDFRGQKASATANITGPGLLHVSTSASFAVPPYDKLKSSASVSFSDQLTFNAAGHAGQTALIFMRYSISGSGSARQDSSGSDTHGSSYASLSLGSGSAFLYGSVSPWGTNGILDPNYKYSPYRIFSTTLGTSSALNLSLNANCQANAFIGAANCQTDLTFKFLGIEAMALLDGTELSGYTVKSQSGFDYINAAAVPEPTTTALFLLGLGAVGVVAKRRRA